MTSSTDPHRRFLRQQALQVSTCWIIVLLAAMWMWRMPVRVEPVVSATLPGKPATTILAPSTIEIATWNVNLWRPFSNEAQPVAAMVAATSPKLYSILQQGNGLTAAIAPGPSAGLVYVKAGDISSGFTVVRVEPTSVVLLINGQEQRLGLGP